MPPFPGGRMMPTRFFLVADLTSFEKARAAPRIFSKGRDESSVPS